MVSGTLTNFTREDTKDYKYGWQDGFNEAKLILERELKKVYREMKKDNLKFAREVKKIKINNDDLVSMTSFTHSHKCNCSYCDIDIKD